MRKEPMTYDELVRRALDAGLTDDAADLLWEIFAERTPDIKNSYPPPVREI